MSSSFQVAPIALSGIRIMSPFFLSGLTLSFASVMRIDVNQIHSLLFIYVARKFIGGFFPGVLPKRENQIICHLYRREFYIWTLQCMRR